MNRRWIAPFVVSLLTAGTAPAAEVTVFAAASLTDALQELGIAWERGGGQRAVFNFAASSTLARQIQEGAPADVFFSADEAKMDELEKRGEIVPGTRRSPLSNSLVVVVPRDSKLRIVGPEDLASPAVRVLALAEPQSVPAGIYAEEYLQRAGIWQALSERMVPTENVRAALAAVESGNADAAIVYKTDAATSSKVRVVYQVPVGEAPRISYALAVMKRGTNRTGGQAFAAYLASPEALSVFERYGFSAPAPSPAP